MLYLELCAFCNYKGKKAFANILKLAEVYYMSFWWEKVKSEIARLEKENPSGNSSDINSNF